MAGFFDGLLDSVQNPLFLGGVGLMSGGPEGLQRGLLAGGQFAQQKKKQAQDQALQQGLMGMSNLNDQDKQILGSSPELAMDVLGKMYSQKFDPNAGLDRRYKEAQINKLNRPETEGGGNYGKTGAIFQDPKSGGYYSVQFGADGRKLIEPIGNGLTPSRGVTEVDTGTGVSIIDKSTGQDVRTIGKDLAGAERDKIVGRETGEGMMQLPKTQSALKLYEAQADIVDQDINDALDLSNKVGTTGFGGGATRNIWGTPAYDLSQKIKTIKGNIGFDKLQNMRDNSPTGGALGSIAVQEMETLQGVMGSLEQAQSGPQLRASLQRFKNVQAQFKEMRRQAYARDVQRFGAANVPNPETGQPQSRGQPTDGWQTLPNGARIREKR